jgi:transcription antitermination factor NusB
MDFERGYNDGVSKNNDEGKKFPFENLNKKERFEQFLTYRKRLTRLAFVQCSYIYETSYLVDAEAKNDSLITNKSSDPISIVRSVIYVYKNIFFPGRYGAIDKRKKLEERFLFQSLSLLINSVHEVDNYIKNNLKQGWTVYRLNPLIRAILRCGTYELLHGMPKDCKIIVNEYVGVATAFFEDQKIGFVNGVLDSINKQIQA